MSLLLARLERQALDNPRAIAVRSGDDQLSYARLWADVMRVARRLAGYRVASLGIYLDNGIDWIVIDLAAIAAGVRLVPLPWFFSDTQLRHAVASGALAGIVFEDRMPAGIAGTGAVCGLYREARLQPVSSLSGAAAGATPGGGKTSFTSGTTGKPRGITLGQASLERCAAGIAAAIPHRDISSQLGILPYSTLLENIAGVQVPLILGKTVYAEPAARIGLTPALGIDPARLQRTFNRLQPSSLILTPQLLQLACELAEQGAIDPACLAFAAVGGARAGESLLRRARAAGIPAYEGYGLTEFGSVATLNTPRCDRIGSVGKPLPGVRVTIAADGEICLQAPVPGQHGRVEVKTGDYGAVDDQGYVYVHGRKSSLIVLPSGRNVSPEWIEAELDASPAIAQSCVFAEGGARLAALLLPAAAAITDNDIDNEIERVNRGLPPYARLGSWCRLAQPFSTANRMLTANGRLRRARIHQRLPSLMARSKTSVPVPTGKSNHHASQETNPCQ